MKIVLAFVAACALLSTVHSAPFESDVKSQGGEDFYDKAAKQDDETVRNLIGHMLSRARAMQSQDDPYSAEEQHSFKEAAKQEDKLARDLIGRKVASDLIAHAMQSQDDPYSVEMQGWLTDILKKYGKRALQFANDYVNGGDRKSAKPRDDKFVSDSIANAMQFPDGDSDVMAAIENLPMKARSQFLFSLGIPALTSLIGSVIG